MSDGLWEFEDIDVDEIHLVGTPANGVPIPVLAKAADAADQKKAKKMSALEKRLKKALGTDLSGHASTAANRQSNDDLNRLLRQATSQTGSNAEGNRMIRQVYKAYERRVIEAQAEVAAAKAVGDDYAQMRAVEELRSARKAQCLAKMVIAENTGANRGPFPNSVALFGQGDACTTHSIGEDRQVGGV